MGRGEHRAPEPAPFKEGEGPPGQGGGDSARHSPGRNGGPAPSEEGVGGEDSSPPQENW